MFPIVCSQFAETPQRENQRVKKEEEESKEEEMGCLRQEQQFTAVEPKETATRGRRVKDDGEERNYSRAKGKRVTIYCPVLSFMADSRCN